MTLIEHDGQRFLALRAGSTWEDSEAHVCLVPVSAPVLADWRAKLALFDRLHAEHGLLYIAFDSDAEWREGDWDAEPIDDDGEIQPPLWAGDPIRSEVDRIEVQRTGIEFCAMRKNTDEHLNAYLWADALDKIEAALQAPAVVQS